MCLPIEICILFSFTDQILNRQNVHQIPKSWSHYTTHCVCTLDKTYVTFCITDSFPCHLSFVFSLQVFRATGCSILLSWRQYLSCDLGRRFLHSWDWPSCSKKIHLWFVLQLFQLLTKAFVSAYNNDVGKKTLQVNVQNLSKLSVLSFIFIFSSLCIVLIKITHYFFLGAEGLKCSSVKKKAKSGEVTFLAFITVSYFGSSGLFFSYSPQHHDLSF